MKFFKLLAVLLPIVTMGATAPQVIPNDNLQIGKSAAGDKTIILNKGSGATNPKIKWNNTTSKLQFSNDGTNYLDIGAGGGAVTNALAKSNGDFQAGTTGWTASGGTFTSTTAAANLMPPYTSSGSWDSGSAGQTLTSTGVAITSGDGLSGQNITGGMYVKCATGTCTHKVQIYDGSTVLAESTITSNTGSFSPTYVTTVAPASGTIYLRLISVASDEPIIYTVNSYLGRADGFNLFQVSQATFYGSATTAGTSSCVWTRTSNASFADYSADADCPTPSVTGAASAPGTKIPAITFSNMPAGEYLIQATSFFRTDANGANCTFRFSDGTSNTSPAQVWSSGTSTGSPTLSGHLSYTSAGTRTISIQATGTDSSVACVVDASVANTEALNIRVYRFPTSSETAIRTDQADYGWTAYTPTFEGLGTVSGVKVYHRKVGENLEVNGHFIPGTTTATPATISLPTGLSMDGTKISNTASSAWIGWANQMTTSGTPANFTATNRFHVFYDGSTANKVFLAVQAGSSQFTKNNGNALLNSGEGSSFFFSVPIQGWRVTSGAPLLVGSVTSNSSGLERVERATITSPTTITSQSGSWLSSVANGSTGNYTLTIAAGIFSATPSCVFQPLSGERVSSAASMTSSTSVAGQFRRVTTPVGDAINSDFTVICMGPR
jgi:hypothetical protein